MSYYERHLFALSSEKKHTYMKYLLKQYQKNNFKCVILNRKCTKKIRITLISEIHYRILLLYFIYKDQIL